MGFIELFKVNLRVIYRNGSGIFWTLIMPALMYVGISVLPLSSVLGSTGSDYAVYLLPGMAALVIMQGGIYTLAYWTIDLKARGVIKRFQTTPIRKIDLVLSLLSARSLVILLQVILLTVIGMLFFGATIQGNPFWIVVLSLLGGFVFLPLGLLIATFADSYEAAAPITAAIGLPFTFLGNVFFPADQLPEALQIVSQFIPITYLADGFRQVFLGTGNHYDLASNIGLLLMWSLFIIALTVWRFRLEE